MKKSLKISAQKIKLDIKSVFIRKLILNSIEKSKRGHICSAFSIIEILRILYDEIIKINPKNFAKRNRHKFILSKGHGCLALYVILYQKKLISMDQLNSFCEFESILGGHPEHHKIPGIEFSTGSLGHGLSVGLGMAISSLINKYNKNIFVLLGDGELQEGSVWEAALSAGSKKIKNLKIIIDYNKIQTFDFVKNVINVEPLAKKWENFGFKVYEVNGHDISNLKKMLNKINQNNLPSVLICHTIKGKGIKMLENNIAWHHKSNITSEEITQLKNKLIKSNS